MRARFLWRAVRARVRDQRLELRLIRAHLRAGDTVCDIGANKGSYLYWLSRWVGPGRVVAFEPQARLAAYLQSICQHWPLRNVTVEARAVDASSGSQTLFVPRHSGTEGSPGASLSQRVGDRETCTATTVPVVALDDYFSPAEKVRLLKIDVEGAERRVFAGAERLLRTSQPLLVFECEGRHLAGGSVAEVLAQLQQWGYRGYFVAGRQLHPVSGFRAEVHQRPGPGRFWEAKGYCNNFVFFPAQAPAR